MPIGENGVGCGVDARRRADCAISSPRGWRARRSRAGRAAPARRCSRPKARTRRRAAVLQARGDPFRQVVTQRLRQAADRSTARLLFASQAISSAAQRRAKKSIVGLATRASTRRRSISPLPPCARDGASSISSRNDGVDRFGEGVPLALAEGARFAEELGDDAIGRMLEAQDTVHELGRRLEHGRSAASRRLSLPHPSGERGPSPPHGLHHSPKPDPHVRPHVTRSSPRPHRDKTRSARTTMLPHYRLLALRQRSAPSPARLWPDVQTLLSRALLGWNVMPPGSTSSWVACGADARRLRATSSASPWPRPTKRRPCWRSSSWRR